MAVVDHELKRHRTLLDDISKRKREGKRSHRFIFKLCPHPSTAKAADGTSTAKKEYEKAKKKYHSLLKKQDTLLRGIYIVEDSLFPRLSFSLSSLPVPAVQPGGGHTS